MLVILHGADSFSRHEAVATLRRDLDRDGMLAGNTTTLDARNLTLSELIMVCDAFPFLATHRLVYIQGLLARTSSERAPRGRRTTRTTRAGAGDDEPMGWDALPDYIDRMPPSTALVLEDGEVRANHPLLIALTPRARVHAFQRLSESEVRGWVAARAHQQGIPIHTAAVDALAKTVPTESAEDGQWHGLWQMAAELDKLRTYAGDRAITDEDVRLLVPAALESRAFLLADAVVERRSTEALRLLEQLLAGGRPAPVLLATLLGRYRQLVIIRESLRSGAARADVQMRAGVRSTWQFDRLRDQAERASMPRLERAYAQIIATDRAVKRGDLDDTTGLELLVAELTGAAGPNP